MTPSSDGGADRGKSAVVGGVDLRVIPLHRLRADQRLKCPIHSRDGVLLLSEGSLLTERALEALRQRGIESVLVNRQETAALWTIEARGSLIDVPQNRPGAKINYHTTSSRRLDQRLFLAIPESMRSKEPAFLSEVRTHGAEPYEESLTQELCQSHEGFISSMKTIVSSILSRQGGADKTTDSIVMDYLGFLARDLDLFACVATAPEAGNYPHRHGLHVAMLSLAMGVKAGLGKGDLRNLASGSLLHDLGMLRVPSRIWQQRNPLTITQRLDLMQHPIHTVEVLEGLDWIPDDVRYVCYQMHERAGGQGYPRRIPGEMIHPLARIASIADAYVAMVSERPYRPAVLPYKAMETILRQVKEGYFDAGAARILLETLSLYPVGSYVLLNDDRFAKVIRSNGPVYHRPIVRAWQRRMKATDYNGEILDLREEAHLEVLAALPAPPV